MALVGIAASFRGEPVAPRGRDAPRQRRRARPRPRCTAKGQEGAGRTHTVRTDHGRRTRKPHNRGRAAGRPHSGDAVPGGPAGAFGLGVPDPPPQPRPPSVTQAGGHQRVQSSAERLRTPLSPPTHKTVLRSFRTTTGHREPTYTWTDTRSWGVRRGHRDPTRRGGPGGFLARSRWGRPALRGPGPGPRPRGRAEVGEGPVAGGRPLSLPREGRSHLRNSGWPAWW